MFKILKIVTILILLPNFLQANTKFFEEGVNLFNSKKYDKAKFKFEQYIVFNPKGEMRIYTYLKFSEFDKKDLRNKI